MNNNNKLEILSKQLKDPKASPNVRAGRDASMDIVNDSKNNRGININIFLTYYYPYFKARINKESIDKDVIVSKTNEWNFISGGHFREVDLLDNNNNVVDVVPPVMIKPASKNVIEDITAFESSVNQYNREKNGHSKAAENKLCSAMAKTKVSLSTDNEIAQHKKRWADFINKYDNLPSDRLMTDSEIKKEEKKIPIELKEKLDLNYD